MDRKNEKEIQESLRELSIRKTVLIIAHRMETIQSANQICVLEKGKVLELGTHEELKKTSATYKKLMGRQGECEVCYDR